MGGFQEGGRQILVPEPAGRHFLKFFRPDSGPPPVHMLLHRNKGKFIGTGQFFPHCMAFLEKGEGLVPVYVFLFPAYVFK